MLYIQGDSCWNVMAHGDAQEGKWRGNWRTEWVASTLHTTSEHGVSSITTAEAHTSGASNRLYWRPHRFKWTRLFRQKTKSGFCACAITFQLASTLIWSYIHPLDDITLPCEIFQPTRMRIHEAYLVPHLYHKLLIKQKWWSSHSSCSSTD